MPVYEFACAGCGHRAEELLPLGQTADRPCPRCGGALRRRFSRIAVRYSAWGFTATDRLVADPGGKDFAALRAKAERIADE